MLNGRPTNTLTSSCVLILTWIIKFNREKISLKIKKKKEEVLLKIGPQETSWNMSNVQHPWYLIEYKQQ